MSKTLSIVEFDCLSSSLGSIAKVIAAFIHPYIFKVILVTIFLLQIGAKVLLHQIAFKGKNLIA